MYDIQIKNAADYEDELQSYVSDTNRSNLFQFYSESNLTPVKNLTINLGIHTQYFALHRLRLHSSSAKIVGVRFIWYLGAFKRMKQPCAATASRKKAIV